MNATPFMLGDLLDDPSLGLELVCGDMRDARLRPVHGAHAIEVDRPCRWLEPDWLMCTTGVLIHDRLDAQRRLVQDLDRLGAAALGFGVGVAAEAVPRGILSEARELGFPVVSIPEPVPFREIIATVARAGHDEALSLSHRVSALQRYLLDALAADDPRAAVLDRLAAVVDATAAVLDARGRAQARTGPLPIAEIWGEIAAGPSRTHAFEVAGWTGLAAPMTEVDGVEGAWLLVASRAAAPHRLAKPAIQAALAILGGLGALGRAERRQDRATRQAVLDTLSSATDAVQERIAVAHAESLGVPIDRGPVAVAFESRHGTAAAVELRSFAQAGLEAARIPHLMGVDGRGAWGLLDAGGPAVRPAVEAMLEGHPDLVAGLGRPARTVADVRTSLRDARLAADHARREHGPRVQDAADFQLSTFLLSDTNAAALMPKVAELLEPLSAHDSLLGTVETYFACSLNVMRAAEELHLHPNSLRYRLSRVEELLGRSLREPSTIADLHLALTAASGAGARRPARVCEAA